MIPLSHEARLLLAAAVAVGGLILLIARWKLNAFIALILASLFVGFCAGMPMLDTAKAFQDGVGSMLSSIAMVVGLGAVLGKLLAESGGAEVIANTLINLLGKNRLSWTILLIAIVVGLPVFFSVGLVLLIPIVFTLARSTGQPLPMLGLPLVAGLSMVHGLTPPHPGPMAAIGQLGADAGKIILYALIVGIPAAALAGPIFAARFAREMVVPLEGAGAISSRTAAQTTPPFGLTLFTITLPILLMLFATVCDLKLQPGDPTRRIADFLGHPLISLTLSVLVACYTLGAARGFSRQQLSKFMESCLGPVAAILLVVGAGGGFNKVLIQSGVGEAVAVFARKSNLSPLLLGWFAAALIRVATGSATVAITTAAGLLAPIVATRPGTNHELLIVAMGAGSLVLSHVNDGGFWFVKEYLNLTVAQTLRTWTVIETIISVVALLGALLLDIVL